MEVLTRNNDKFQMRGAFRSLIATFHAGHGASRHLVDRVDLGDTRLMHVHTTTIQSHPLATLTQGVDLQTIMACGGLGDAVL